MIGIAEIITKIVRITFELLSLIIFPIINFKKYHKQLPPIRNALLLESASSLAEKIRSHQVSSEEIVEIFIKRIKCTNPSLNAIVEDRFMIALKEAKQVDQYLRQNPQEIENLRKTKPFFGVPITIKENLKLKGFHATVGLQSWKNNIAKEDCESVRIMKESGAIILGTTNVPELVMWWETSNTIYGRTNNPYDTRRMVGGSSGGEAAIIAAAGSPFGIGSDIAGSIRMPAHFNGIFGHKASTGVISSVGMEPNTCELYNKYRTSGPLCRFACDLRPTLSLLTAHTKLVDFDKKVNLKNLKIYYMEEDGGYLTTPVSREMKDGLRKTVKYFQTKHNALCEKVNITELKSLPMFLAKLGEDPNIPSIGLQLTNGESDINLEWEAFKMMFVRTNYTFPSLLLAALRKYLVTDPSSDKFKNIMKKFQKLSDIFKKLLTDNAIFLYPPSPTTALLHRETHFKPFNFMYTGMFNMLGLPVTVCPLGLSSAGLPISVQVVGGLHQDNLCISVAEEIENAFGGWVCP